MYNGKIICIRIRTSDEGLVPLYDDGVYTVAVNARYIEDTTIQFSEEVPTAMT